MLDMLKIASSTILNVPFSGHKFNMYGKWSSDSMNKAMHAVRVLNVSQKSAAEQFQLPRQTLRRHLNGSNKHAVDGKKHLGRAPILDTQLERELCEHVLLLESMLFGVSKETLQQLAYQLAVRNQIPDAKSFNVDKQCAGRKWFTNFLRRNPEVSVRTPEATSIARAAGFNQKSVDVFRLV